MENRKGIIDNKKAIEGLKGKVGTQITNIQQDITNINNNIDARFTEINNNIDTRINKQVTNITNNVVNNVNTNIDASVKKTHRS